ncbi:hypothetical protein BKA70DRAFT_1085339, partial [Coprinopsis sp. MPI-PUGE-AT-0042]
YKLTVSQTAYLREHSGEYNDATKKAEKLDICKKVASHLISELQSLTKGKVSQATKTRLKSAVEEWFRRNSASQKVTKARKWGIKWHGRLVFQYERPNAINYISRLLAAEEPLPDLSDFLGLAEDDIVIGDSVLHPLPFDEDEIQRPSVTALAAFGKYQVATTTLWDALPEVEQERYHQEAEDFRKEGPPLATKQKMAKRFATQRCHEFAESMMQDLDSRVYILVGYRDDTGKPYAVECEFTADLGGGENFKTLYKKQLKEMELLDDWADYVGTAYRGDDEGDAQRVAHRTNRKPLADLPLNTYGEPQLPSIGSRPQGTQLKIWLTQIFRSFLTISYCECYLIPTSSLSTYSPNLALAVGLPPGTYHSVPFKRLKKDIRAFLSEEVLPDRFLECFDDPAFMSINDLTKLYEHVYERQQKSDEDPAWEFTHFVHKKGPKLLPRVARREIYTFSDEDEEYD